MDKKTVSLDKLPVPNIKVMKSDTNDKCEIKPEYKTYLDEYFAPDFIKSYFTL